MLTPEEICDANMATLAAEFTIKDMQMKMIMVEGDNCYPIN